MNQRARIIVPGAPCQNGGYTGQRILDLCLGILAAIVLSPVVVVGMVLVKLTSCGPVFYWQTRTGRCGFPFQIVKLRTMYHDCEATTGAVWATQGDCRITSAGRVLRMLHIDEIPQLWNVVCGEMSLVGPRPERPEIIEILQSSIPDYGHRLAVRPGMTGLAQIQHPADSTLDSARQKQLFDLTYIRLASFSLDVRVLWGTVWYLFKIPYSLVRKLAALPPVSSVYETRTVVNLPNTLSAASDTFSSMPAKV